MSFVIGIDQGTSGIKAVLTNDLGDVVSVAVSRYPLIQAKPGWVEQDPNAWWSSLKECVQKVTENINKKDVSGIAISGQINGVVLIDANHSLLGNSIIWLDQRAELESEEANRICGQLIRDVTYRSISSVTALSKVLWIKSNLPKIYRRVKKIVTPLDWLNFKLTGEVRCELTGASFTGALDIERRMWSSEVLNSLDVDLDLFGDLSKSEEILGTLNKSVASELGLEEATRVYGGAGDIPSLILGSGCINEGRICIGVGTAGHVVTSVNSLNGLGPDKLWPMCHVIPEKYGLLGCTFTGGAAMNWFVNNFDITYDQLIKEASMADKYEASLFFMPWLKGTSVPVLDTSIKGGFFGLDLRHSRGSIIRSMIEGVIFELRHSIEVFKSIGVDVNEIRVGEGWAQSELWMSIQSAVFGRQVQVVETKELSAVGASIIANTAEGNFSSYDEAAEACVKMGNEVTPVESYVNYYQEKYERYCDLYKVAKLWYSQVA